jgi:putative transposase
MVGASVLRRQVAYAKKRGLSNRKACALLGTARSGLAYQSKLDERDAPVLASMREHAGQYPRYGYRRIRVFLRRKNFVMDGRQIKCLTAIDEWTRECLAIDVAGSIRSGRVVDVLSRPVSIHGAPRHLRCDNGPEFISRAILTWLGEAGIDTAFIDPGKPWQNGANESFTDKFRDECLSLEWFRSRAEAAATIESWRAHYNVLVHLMDDLR